MTGVQLWLYAVFIYTYKKAYEKCSRTEGQGIAPLGKTTYDRTNRYKGHKVMNLHFFACLTITHSPNSLSILSINLVHTAPGRL